MFPIINNVNVNNEFSWDHEEIAKYIAVITYTNGKTENLSCYAKEEKETEWVLVVNVDNWFASCMGSVQRMEEQSRKTHKIIPKSGIQYIHFIEKRAAYDTK
jgi:hypothetical protein